MIVSALKKMRLIWSSLRWEMHHLRSSGLTGFSVWEEVSHQLHKMQDTGIILPSHSLWAIPIVLIRKRDGTHRFVLITGN